MPSAVIHKADCLADLAVTILKTHIHDALLHLLDCDVRLCGHTVTLQSSNSLRTGCLYPICMHCNMQDSSHRSQGALLLHLWHTHKHKVISACGQPLDTRAHCTLGGRRCRGVSSRVSCMMRYDASNRIFSCRMANCLQSVMQFGAHH